MKNILLFIGTTLITLIFFEIFLKGTRITPPTAKYFNEIFGALNRPNIDYMKCKEGLYLGKTNYDGRFRENYSMRKKDKKTLRIGLIGDSFVEGIDVFSRDHFAQIMEDKLKKQLHCNVEILDFGRGNCTITNSSFYFVNHIIPNYDLDLILYFTEYRDIFVETGYPSASYILNDSTGVLETSNSWRKTPEYSIHKKLTALPVLKYYEDIAFTRLAYRTYSGVKQMGFALQTFGKFVGEPSFQTYQYEKKEGEVSATTKKVFEKIMQYSNGQVLFVVRHLPFDAQVVQDYFEEKRYPYIDLRDTFAQQLIKGTQTNAHFFKTTQSFGGHWNHEGHIAVGNFLANRVYQNLGQYKMPNYQHE